MKPKTPIRTTLHQSISLQRVVHTGPQPHSLQELLARWVTFDELPCNELVLLLELEGSR